MKKNNKIDKIAYIAIFGIAMLNCVIFSVPFIKYIFYDQMIALTQATNEQLGWLMTIYGLGEVFTLPIGGVLAERCNPKKVLSICGICTGIACFVLATAPSYYMTCIIWFVLIFTTLFMCWGSIFKALRLIGPDEVQGKIMGFYYGANGIGYVIVNLILSEVCDHFSKTSLVLGMKSVFYTLGVLAILAGIVVYLALSIALKKSENNNQEDLGAVQNETMLHQVKTVLKYKTVWVFGITLFCVYGMQVAITYFTPYFTDVLGIGLTFGGVIAIFRTYGMQAIGSPIGGIIADKIHSSAKVVITCCVAAALCMVAILMLPNVKSLVFVVAVVFIAAWFNGMSYGVQYSITAEGYIPQKHMATAVGIGSAIGFMPDVFQHTLFGYWMDKYGNTGYKYMFLYGIALCVICIVLLIVFIKNKEKIKLEIMQQNIVQEVNA